MKRLITLLLFISPLLSAQNTISFEKETIAPKANLSHVAWLEGHWKGSTFRMIVEEIWSPPLGGSMMFSFKHVADGNVTFYKLGHIREVEETLVFQLKHFGENLKCWKEKDETVDAKLVTLDDNKLYFNDFTFEKVNENEINNYVVVDKNGTSEEVKFNYKRV